MTAGGFYKKVIIDGKGHIMGRLAATVAKQLLEGQMIVIVRVEEVVISGSLQRNKLQFASFLAKTCNTNPIRGAKHYRTPSKMFWRTVRGMLPHKTKRGAKALSHLKIFEGIPAPYDKKKRLVVPRALSICRWDPQTKHCILGELAKTVGWKYHDVVARLESKRTARATEWFAKKKAMLNLVRISEKKAAPETKDLQQQLAALGYAH
jgi:large subunit ribosomal protein L13Ae